MRKSALSAAVAAAGLISAPAIADNTITISGSVPLVCNTTFSASETASSLNIVSTGAQPLGDAHTTCNSSGGFTLKLDSANGSQLEDNNAATSNAVQYQVKATGDLDSGGYQQLDLTLTETGFSSKAAQGNHVVYYTINFENEPLARGGVTYSDTLTLTITAL